MNGATGIIVGYGKGILHTIHAKKNINLDIIPVDFVVNAIIAAAWKHGSKQVEEFHQPSDDGIIAYINYFISMLMRYILIHTLILSKIISFIIYFNM